MHQGAGFIAENPVLPLALKRDNEVISVLKAEWGPYQKAPLALRLQIDLLTDSALELVSDRYEVHRMGCPVKIGEFSIGLRNPQSFKQTVNCTVEVGVT